MVPVPDRPQWLSVPAGTRPARCKGPSCGARVYWTRTARGKLVLVDCAVEGGVPPSESADTGQTSLLETGPVHAGRGVSHFQTCPDADRFG